MSDRMTDELMAAISQRLKTFGATEDVDQLHTDAWTLWEALKVDNKRIAKLEAFLQTYETNCCIGGFVECVGGRNCTSSHK